MQRHSKIRDRILACLESTKDHPSAEWVYAQLKPLCPNLSLATVYRNLNQLKEAGVIASMGEVLGHERFDFQAAPHTHAVCRKCGRIVDVDEVTMPENLAKSFAEATGFETKDAALQLIGLCPECRKRE